MPSSRERGQQGTTRGTAVKVARKLADGSASCIVGAWAPATRSGRPRKSPSRGGILQISPATTADEIARVKDDGLLNRTVPADSLQGPALADAAEQALGVRVGACSTSGPAMTPTAMGWSTLQRGLEGHGRQDRPAGRVRGRAEELRARRQNSWSRAIPTAGPSSTSRHLREGRPGAVGDRAAGMPATPS